MPKQTETNIAEDIANLSLFDTVFLVQKFGKDQQHAEAVNSGFVDPEGKPDVVRPSEGIDYDESIEQLVKQLRFNIKFDDFDFSGLIERARIDPAVGLEEMQLLADAATQPRPAPPPPPAERPFDPDAGDFLAFSSFDDIIT